MYIKKLGSLYKITGVLIAGITLLLTAATAVSADDTKPEVSFLSDKALAPHRKTIVRLEEYLSGLTTIVSDFTQVAPDGALASGKFYLQRPGKMRWQYHPPTPILIVADGKELVFYDYELEQESHIPLDSTLIGLLAQEKIHFGDSVGITEFEQEKGVIRIGLAQRDKPDEGRLMLEFSDDPLLIRNLVVTDASRQKTTVALNNAAFGAKLDKELFIFKEIGKRRRKG